MNKKGGLTLTPYACSPAGIAANTTNSMLAQLTASQTQSKLRSRSARRRMTTKSKTATVKFGED